MTTRPAPRRGRPPSGGREAILRTTLALLREQGVARFTTREVARRAGVSEASIFYHFTDRPGLLQAVFAMGLEPLQGLDETPIDDPDRVAVLHRLTTAIEGFLEQSLPVLMAAQSDVALREAMAAYLTAHDIGPHRGVRAVGRYLRSQQEQGLVDAAVDVDAVATALVATCFLRVSQRQIMTHGSRLPSAERTVAMFAKLLDPATAP
jgi:AcrR family transcriptional regulator